MPGNSGAGVAGVGKEDWMAHRQDQPDVTAGESVVVVIPTYNERDNLGPVVQRLHAALPAAHALIVDDNSPDGTGALADELAAEDARVHVLHRPGKAGLGVAYVAGFEWVLAGSDEVIVEMDADGSHDPAELPRLLSCLDRTDVDVVIGSRYVAGGRTVNWPWHRRWLSRGANVYSKIALGLRIYDVTAGFRVYRRRVLETLALRDVASQGYCFQVDLTLRSVAEGFTVAEVPITFVERATGRSKMSGEIVREALLRVTAWGLQRRYAQLTGLFRGRR